MLPVGRGIARSGITPNGLTAVGLGLNVAAAAILANGWYTAGSLAFLVASAFDTLDGAVARATDKATPFGAFFDSVADRYSEAVIFLGLLVGFATREELFSSAAALLALLGSLMVSYARARAEGLGVDCEIGLLQRTERVLLLALGLLASDLLLTPILWLLAVATNLTVVQRALHVRRALAAREREATQGEPV
jgi:CDP-diacylglycerol--glycerol-3-phosphate 3-phosphatidyltransferase